MEEGAAWSVFSAGLLRRTQTAVLLCLNVHMFAPHLQYRRIHDTGAHSRSSRWSVSISSTDRKCKDRCQTYVDALVPFDLLVQISRPQENSRKSLEGAFRLSIRNSLDLKMGSKFCVKRRDALLIIG